MTTEPTATAPNDDDRLPVGSATVRQAWAAANLLLPTFLFSPLFTLFGAVQLANGLWYGAPFVLGAACAQVSWMTIRVISPSLYNSVSRETVSAAAVHRIHRAAQQLFRGALAVFASLVVILGVGSTLDPDHLTVAVYQTLTMVAMVGLIIFNLNRVRRATRPVGMGAAQSGSQ